MTPIPMQVVYAGLVGVLLALIVATATNGWKPKVFFLLALRLAIGWQFLFEGMHKIHSHMVGPTETNRPFTSEPYFKAAPGPVGEFMRKQAQVDPVEAVKARVVPTMSVTAAEFAKKSATEQAGLCPEFVAKELDAYAAKAEASAKIEEVKAKYARWVYGVDRRDAKARYFNSDVPQSAPERLAQLALLKADVTEHESRFAVGLGNGNGIENARLAALKTELLTGYTDLAKDADAFVGELKKVLAGDKKVEADKPAETQIQFMDRLTMWFIAVVGGCILFGLFTRLSCVLAAGFLVMTYLLHPPFPWYTLPPGTEGNPLFINKNLIETFALLALACMPTGRWLGVDALIHRVLFGAKKK